MKTLLCFLVALTAAAATPVKLSNLQANELLITLSQIGPGLTAQNTTCIARNINALRPLVEAWSKGDQAARDRLKITATTPIESPNGTAYLAEAKRNNEEIITVELSPVKISDEEIVAAKIAPPVLSLILLRLAPPDPAAAH